MTFPPQPNQKKSTPTKDLPDFGFLDFATNVSGTSRFLDLPASRYITEEYEVFPLPTLAMTSTHPRKRGLRAVIGHDRPWMVPCCATICHACLLAEKEKKRRRVAFGFPSPTPLARGKKPMLISDRPCSPPGIVGAPVRKSPVLPVSHPILSHLSRLIDGIDEPAGPRIDGRVAELGQAAEEESKNPNTGDETSPRSHTARVEK